MAEKLKKSDIIEKARNIVEILEKYSDKDIFKIIKAVLFAIDYDKLQKKDILG